MTYCGYIRVSAKGNRGGDSFRSPEDQAADIRAFAKARGLTVKILEPDIDHSGGNTSRPSFDIAVAGCLSGKYEGMIVWEYSRFFRDVLGDLTTEAMIADAGGKLLSTTEDFDVGAFGRFMRITVSNMNELQRGQASERFIKLLDRTAERGLWKFRIVPLGYQLAGERPSGLIPGQDAPRLRAAFKARLKGPDNGGSISAIARMLGVTPSGARAILRNRVYLGEIKIGKRVKTGAHEPLIDVETFDAVQQLRQVRPRRGGEAQLLAGLIRCQSCGHIMRGGSGGKGHRTYSCHGAHSAGRCPAPAAITGQRVDELVEAAARDFIADWRFSTARRTDSTDALRDDLAKAKTELEVFLRNTAAANLPPESFIAAARQRQEAIDAAQSALDQRMSLTPIQGLFDSGDDFWDDLKTHERNQLLRGLLDAVVVTPAGRGKLMPVGDRVRLFVRGSLGDITYGGGGAPLPIRRLPFPGVDDERLLGVASLEDGLSGLGA